MEAFGSIETAFSPTCEADRDSGPTPNTWDRPRRARDRLPMLLWAAPWAMWLLVGVDALLGSYFGPVILAGVLGLPALAGLALLLFERSSLDLNDRS
jgi:hypothetical protein